MARRPDGAQTGNLLCGMNSRCVRHFLIAVPNDGGEIQDERSRGLRVRLRELIVAGEPTRIYIDIECGDQSAHDLFDVFGNDLAKALSDRPAEPFDVVRAVLAKWRRFWADLPRAILADAELIGLFGELWFLHLWLAPCVTLPLAIRSWRGPVSSRHDFEAPGKAIEVKTTSSRQGRIHKINGLDQLEAPENGILLFFSLHVQREMSATNTVPALIDLIRQGIGDDADALSDFENLLALANYSDVFRNHYLEHRFRVVDSDLFEVAGAFPRLTKVLLSNSRLLPGVGQVSYEIDLAGHVGSALCSEPAKAMGVLTAFR